MNTVHTIRVINYCGDRDDYNDLNIIGPYDTAADRDRDMYRIASLPDVYGSLRFERSGLHPDNAENSCAPRAVADAADLNGVLIALRLILPPAVTEPKAVAGAAPPQ